MVEPLGWWPEIPPVDPYRLLRFLRARLAEGGRWQGDPSLLREVLLLGDEEEVVGVAGSPSRGAGRVRARTVAT
jgi:hypothetical protein